ncbi:MAG: hypothetical protein V1737_04050, partial [Chloroflexota bacterium]
MLYWRIRRRELEREHSAQEAGGRYHRSGDKVWQIRLSADYCISDNGPEFIARATRSWLNRLGVKALFIEPG